jgi:NAD(P)-dependent dehydrogenase (short-subunit alcohol dehydrogenase family)
LGRVGNHRELADLACFLVSDGSGYINGEVVTIDGGEWLMGAGQFNFLSALTEQDWQALKPKKKN